MGRFEPGILGRSMAEYNIFVYHSTLAYRTLFFLYYTILPIIILWWGHEYKDDSWFFLAGFFVGFAAFTKLEGIGHILVYLCLLFFLLSRSPTLSRCRKT